MARQPAKLCEDTEGWVGSRVKLPGKPTLGTVTRMGASKHPSVWVLFDDKDNEVFLYTHSLEKA